MFLMLYSVNWPHFVAWLSLLLEMLGKLCIAIVCFPGCDVIRFEINLIFLIKSFYYTTKKSRQRFEYLENEKGFQGDIKSIFYQVFSCQKLSKKCAFNVDVCFTWIIAFWIILRNFTIERKLYRYTNADLKICQYLYLHMKIICWRSHIKTAFTCEICTSEKYERFFTNIQQQ